MLNIYSSLEIFVVTAPMDLILEYSYERQLCLCVFYLKFGCSKVRNSVCRVVVIIVEGLLVNNEGYMKSMLQSHKDARICGLILLCDFMSASSS